jgi:hypothetical protein
MATVQTDERGGVSIPPDMLRQIGVLADAPVAIEIRGTVIVVGPPSLPPQEVESYSPERKAELLLNNAVNAADYADVVNIVLAMGLDPARIPHDRPMGA